MYCLYIVRAHEKIAHRRYDFIQQYSASLVRENQVPSFAVEYLHVKGMMRNEKLVRSIADHSWGGEFSLYEGRWHGKDVLTIVHFVASSKPCHVCGHKQEKNASICRGLWLCW